MWELYSISELMMVETTSFSHLTSLSSHPLFSSIITLLFVIFIFCPHLLPIIIFSPVPILTAILLIFLLRLGATQRNSTQSCCDNENNCNQSEKLTASPEKDELLVVSQPDTLYVSDLGFERNLSLEERFREWNVRAPLQVIYEEYEGEEEEEEEEDKSRKRNESNMSLERYPSLSMYYPESDSDSSTDGEYTTIGAWEEEEREDLIEICLDWSKMESEIQAEEENLIEIDISPTRNGGVSTMG